MAGPPLTRGQENVAPTQPNGKAVGGRPKRNVQSVYASKLLASLQIFLVLRVAMYVCHRDLARWFRPDSASLAYCLKPPGILLLFISRQSGEVLPRRSH
jgi:hypothetical protein